MSEPNFSLLRQGLFIGLAIAVPVGPISILCIQRSIKKGFVSGLVSGLGASTGDAIYAFIGTFGLNLIVVSLISQKMWFGLISGMFLCCLGVKTFLDRPAIDIDNVNLSTADSCKRNRLLKDYVTLLVLDLTNPITILVFAAALTKLYAKNVDSDSVSGYFFVLGVFTSAALWRVCLSGIAHRLSGRFNPRQLQWINRVAGVMISTFGCASIYSAWS
jgi:threonine/homoserine/homoserine lactone efflux protein